MPSSPASINVGAKLSPGAHHAQHHFSLSADPEKLDALQHATTNHHHLRRQQHHNTSLRGAPRYVHDPEIAIPTSSFPAARRTAAAKPAAGSAATDSNLQQALQTSIARIWEKGTRSAAT